MTRGRYERVRSEFWERSYEGVRKALAAREERLPFLSGRQLVAAAAAELEARRADQVDDDAGHQHLAGPGERRDASGRLRHRPLADGPEPVPFSGVQPDAERQPLASGFLHDRARAAERAGRTVERRPRTGARPPRGAHLDA